MPKESDPYICMDDKCAKRKNNVANMIQEENSCEDEETETRLQYLDYIVNTSEG